MSKPSNPSLMLCMISPILYCPLLRSGKEKAYRPTPATAERPLVSASLLSLSHRTAWLGAETHVGAQGVVKLPRRVGYEGLIIA